MHKRDRIFDRHFRLQSAFLHRPYLHSCTLTQQGGSSRPAYLPLSDVLTPHGGQLGDELLLGVTAVALVRCLVVRGLVNVGLRNELAAAPVKIDACLPAVFTVAMALLTIVGAAAGLRVLNGQLFFARKLQQVVRLCLLGAILQQSWLGDVTVCIV